MKNKTPQTRQKEGTKDNLGAQPQAKKAAHTTPERNRKGRFVKRKKVQEK